MTTKEEELLYNTIRESITHWKECDPRPDPASVRLIIDRLMRDPLEKMDYDRTVRRLLELFGHGRIEPEDLQKVEGIHIPEGRKLDL